VKPWRDVLANATLAAASLALGLAALEGAARVLVHRWERRPHTTRGSIIRFDPILGWDKPPGAEVWLHRREYDVNLTVNSHGLRGPDRGYEKPSGGGRVLLLGDSFTEGFTVREEDTVRAVLESLLLGQGCRGWEVINAGTLGYSTDQEYLFFLNEGRRYQPDVVVVLFFYNDLNGNITTGSKPHFTVEDGRLVLHDSPLPPPREGPWTRAPEARPFRIPPWRGSMALRLLGDRTSGGNPPLHRALGRLGLVEPAKIQPMPQDFWVFGPGHRDEVSEMWRRTAAILGALKAAVEEAKAHLVVLYIPDETELNERVGELTRQKYGMGRRWWSWGKVLARLKTTCERLEIPLVIPNAALQEAESRGLRPYFPEDGHWNETGHRVAAAELAHALGESGLVPCPPAAAR
jgi:lysophospholipase L1-like esterase